jgi:putative hydrolase of the HAD superfamily
MAPDRRITTITLDWGDTLAANYGMPHLRIQRRAFERLGADLRALGCEVPTGFADQAMTELSGDWTRSIDPLQNPDHREFDFTAMLAGWVAAVGGMEAHPHRVRQAITRCTTQLTDTVIPFTDTAPALSMLKARGYRLGILSHTSWPGDACREWFARHGLAGYIDFYSLSCEVGWIKPHPRHFQHALDQSGAAPDQVLHVGDHPMRDIQGARAHGFRTCLRVTENIYPHDALAACGPDAEIIHLRELLEVAERLG